jgi:TatD DNase family protein
MPLQLVDTHCHIHSAYSHRTDGIAKKWHDSGYSEPKVLANDALEAGITKLVCVGTDLSDSQDAVKFVADQPNCWASVGVHPHEAKEFLAKPDSKQQFEALLTDKNPKIVAIGEFGLDYYYEHSNRDSQQELLRYQLELAVKHNLPCIFHIRDAFLDFWTIYDQFVTADQVLTGVIHSFTGNSSNVEQIVSRGLYVGLNGIMTFTKDAKQLEAAKLIPLEKIVLETDAPYLTPKPYRGKICKSEFVRLTAEFLAELRGEPLEELAEQTTVNVSRLFNFKTL